MKPLRLPLAPMLCPLLLAAGPSLPGPVIPVPADPRATWHDEGLSAARGGLVLLTRRDGPDGARWSRRTILCRENCVQLTAAARTRAAVDRIDWVSAMLPARPGSVDAALLRYACARPR